MVISLGIKLQVNFILNNFIVNISFNFDQIIVYKIFDKNYCLQNFCINREIILRKIKRV